MLKHRAIALGLLIAAWVPGPLLAVELKESPTPLSPEPAPAQLGQAAPIDEEKSPIVLPEGEYEIKVTEGEKLQLPEQTRSTTEPDTANIESIHNQFNNMVGSLADTITPLCTTLNINTIYTLEGPTTGGSYCYHFEITQRAKTQAFIVEQNENTDFALTLVRHESDDTLTALGTSDSAGNADELVMALTETGHYYWLMDANTADGTPIQFGAIVDTNIDAHEPNDTVATATTVPQRDTLVGNMDSAQDIDYFYYVAEDGQNIEIEIIDTYGQGEWVLEYFTGSAWAPLNTNTKYELTNLPVPFTLVVRVSPNPQATVNPAHEYELLLGAVIAATDQNQVGTTENLVRLGTYDFDPYLTTQVHNEINWSIRVLDSKRNPMEGVRVQFYYLTTEIPLQVYEEVSNASGIAGGTINVPECDGDVTVVHQAPNGQVWETELDVGGWWIDIEDALHPEDVGVAGTENEPYVTIGHLCDQTYLP